jgi:hypothetical protein
MIPIVWAMVPLWWRIPLALAQPPAWCCACGMPGHIAAHCPYELWRRK